MFMLAAVINTGRDHMMVFDLATRQRVRVITRNTCCFRRGTLVRIRYDGVMTQSIPPQITAQGIVRVPGFVAWP